MPVGGLAARRDTVGLVRFGEQSVTAPISLIVSAFAPVGDARRTRTPQLDLTVPSRLLLIDLGFGKNRLGGSCWAQVHGLGGGIAPDLDSAPLLRQFFDAVLDLKDAGLCLAYHDGFKSEILADTVFFMHNVIAVLY